MAYNTLAGIQTALSTTSGDDTRAAMAELIKQLMTEIATQKDPTASLLALKTYIQDNPKVLTATQTTSLTAVMTSMSTATTKQSQ